MKLPGKEYYFIKEVAEAWGCSVDDLFHYAIHRGLRIGVRFFNEILYGLNSDYRTVGAYFVTGVLTVPKVSAEAWEAGNDAPYAAGGFVVEKDYPPHVFAASKGDEDPLGPPMFAWARGRGWDNPDEDTATIGSFLRSEESLLDIFKDSIVIHAVERERFEAEALCQASQGVQLDSEFSWYMAKQTWFDFPPLRGVSWPSGLATTQIAKLHFSESAAAQRALLAQLDTAVRAGQIPCLAVWVIDSPGVPEIPAMHRGTVLFESGAMASAYLNLGKRALCKPRGKLWHAFLTETAREKIGPSSINIREQLPSGIPLAWTITPADRKPLYYRTCFIISASNYSSWEGRQPFPEQSPLRGWFEKYVAMGEMRGGLNQPNHTKEQRSASSDRQIEDQDTRTRVAPSSDAGAATRMGRTKRGRPPDPNRLANRLDELRLATREIAKSHHNPRVLNKDAMAAKLANINEWKGYESSYLARHLKASWWKDLKK